MACLSKCEATTASTNADEKCLVLAKEIKLLVDDKAQCACWSALTDIKNQLNMDLTVLLYKTDIRLNWTRKCSSGCWSRQRILRNARIER